MRFYIEPNGEDTSITVLTHDGNRVSIPSEAFHDLRRLLNKAIKNLDNYKPLGFSDKGDKCWVFENGLPCGQSVHNCKHAGTGVDQRPEDPNPEPLEAQAERMKQRMARMRLFQARMLQEPGLGSASTEPDNAADKGL